MNTPAFKFSIAAMIMALTFSACQKYEDGPLASPYSKKARVANTWFIEQAMDEGNDVTDSYDQYELQLTKNGDATLTSTQTWGDITVTFESDGTWDFSDSKEHLILDFEDDNADDTYRILRLTNNEMWIRESGDDLELHLATK